MAILKSFLCLCNTRTGSLISGCYTLTISLVCLVYYLFRYVGHKLVEDSAEYKGIIYVGFVLYGFMIVSSLVIIPGVQLDKRYLLLPWIYIIILMVLYDTGSVALLTTVHMEREKTLHVWEIIWVFFYLFRLAANCYCFTCVVSQYQELSDGRGTYDYLYKPRRRRRFRNGSQFDLDTFDLPFGVHLPPYIEEDQTENNPPAYETIYPQPEISTQTNNTENEYAEIEINQPNTNFINDHYTQIDNNSYPLPVDENCYHSNPENMEQEMSENTLQYTSVQSNLNHSQSLTFGRYIDLHRRPLSCCYGDEVYHFPHCPHHNHHIHHRHLHDIYHNHHPHHHHHHHRDSSPQLAGQYQPEQGEGPSLGQDLRCTQDLSLDPSSRSQQESRSGLLQDNPGFKRDSQCYEVTVNIEWI